MAEFNTTGIQQNAPGLTYATPQAMPGKYSTLGGVLDVANTTIKGAVALDKSMTLTEAQQLAEEQANIYKEGSITNQQILSQEKTVTEQNLMNAPEAEKPMFEQQLDEINLKLSRAKEQGLISPTEFKTRLLSKTAELANSNPAYGAEIAARVNEVMGYTGVNDLVTMDTSYYKAQQDARDAAMKDIDTVLKEYSIPTVGVDDETKYLQYQIVLEEARTYKMAQLLVDQNKAVTNADKIEFESEVRSKGGIYSLGAIIWQNTYLNMQKNINNPALSDQEKYNEHIKLINNAEQILINSVTRLPENVAYTKYFDMQMATIANLKAESKDLLTGKVTSDTWANRAATAKNQSSYEMYAQGRNPDELEYNKKLTELLVNIDSNSLLTINNATRSQLGKDYAEVVGNFITTGGGAPNPNLPSVDSYLNGNLMGSIKVYNENAKELLKTEGSVGAIGGHFNGLLIQSQKYSGNTRMSDLDIRLNKMSIQMDQEVFTNLMTMNPDFNNLTQEAAMFYSNGIKQEAARLAQDSNVIAKLELDPESGLVREKNMGNTLGSLTQRINTFIKFRAKMMNKKPGDVMQDVLVDDLSFGPRNETDKKEYTDGEFTVRIKQ